MFWQIPPVLPGGLQVAPAAGGLVVDGDGGDEGGLEAASGQHLMLAAPGQRPDT